MRYAAAAPTTPTSPIPAKSVVDDPWSGVVPEARALGPGSVPVPDAAGVPDVVAEVGAAGADAVPEVVALRRGVVADGVVRPADGVVPAVALPVLVPFADVPLDVVPPGVELLCAGVEELVRGVLDGFGVGVGVEDELGFGVLVLAGGAELGCPPEPNANPMTVPGAGS